MKNLDWPKIWGDLGDRIKKKPNRLEVAKVRATQTNPWFTAAHIAYALDAITEQFLNENAVRTWLQNYEMNGAVTNPLNVGLICAGNIPLVGMHDIICVLTSGHRALIKLSSKDALLIPAVMEVLVEIYPEVKSHFEFVEQLNGHDAVIATGSNNSLRYFKSYFGHLPHIFRNNRTSIGIIHATDTVKDLKPMAEDIFIHFGLGCRNISKLLIPKGFDLDILFEASVSFGQYKLHSKYNNNFIYHTALFQMNKVNYFTNDLFILLETEELHAPLSVIYYEKYDEISNVASHINEIDAQLQVIYSTHEIDGLNTTKPGRGQKPGLADYPDQKDVLRFLLELNESA